MIVSDGERCDWTGVSSEGRRDLKVSVESDLLDPGQGCPRDGDMGRKAALSRVRAAWDITGKCLGVLDTSLEVRRKTEAGRRCVTTINVEGELRR